jgi:hypothetical protein
VSELKEDQANTTKLLMYKSVHIPAGDVPQVLRGSLDVSSTYHYTGEVTACIDTSISFEAIATESKYFEPVIINRASKPLQPRFVSLQKWEGIVDTVLPQSFTARLMDKTNAGPDMEAEFDVEEIDYPDRSLIKPGAVFYWTLGYSDSPTGQRTRLSILRFRRLPVWRESDLKRYSQQAKEIREAIAWE